MDAQLEQIGARCHFCSRQDFLPFQCTQCTHHFCLLHSTPSHHACPVAAPVTPSSPSKDQDAKTHISLRALQDDLLSRRSQVAPRTTAVRQESTASETSRAALAKLKTLSASFQRVKGQASQDRARLQTLKGTARGDAGVSLERRLYLYASQPSHTQVPYWVDREWSVGRTLDAVAKKLGVENENARTQDESRRLHLLCDGLVLEPSQEIGRRVKDGSHVVLFRGPRPVDL